MELRHLRYLIVLAEELHFSRAAIRLNISQPPLSQQIRQLEKELGVQLFERTKRHVRLTEPGKRIVKEARQVLARVDHFAKVASQAGGGEIGHLSVGVAGGVNEVLVDTLRLLGRNYPGVHIELQYLSTGMQVEALRERRIDVGFLNMPLQEPTLVIERIKTEPLKLALPKGHPLTRLQRIPLSALADQRFILFPRRVTPGLHDTVTGMCRKAGFTLNVVHEVDSMVGGLTLVSAGMGVAFGTPSVQRLWPDIAFRPISPEASVEQAVAYNQGGPSSPVLDIFLRALHQAVRKSGLRDVEPALS
jgi:DNA-binding transcriptional LysR family regulator